MIVGIIGLGAMGLGIAQVYAQAGHQVLATDAQAGSRASAVSRLAAALEPRVSKGALSAEARDLLLSRVVVVDTIAALAPAMLVIEAVVEKLSVNRLYSPNWSPIFRPRRYWRPTPRPFL